MSNGVEENEEIDGVSWEKDADVPEPVKKSSFGGSTIKPNYQRKFDTELSSFWPLSLCHCGIKDFGKNK
eukprot:5587759-Ditylum_brightwellii.AAC.1